MSLINYTEGYFAELGIKGSSTASFGIEEPLILLAIIPLMLLLYLYLKKKEKGEEKSNRKQHMTLSKWFFLFMRFLIVLFILISLASPFILHLKEEKHPISIEILDDGSKSMSIYNKAKNTTAGEDLFFKFNEYPSVIPVNGSNDESRKMTPNGKLSVNLRKFSREGNKTEIGNALYQESIKDNRNDIIVIASDGKNNYGREPVDVANILKETTKIYSLLPPQPIMPEVFISEIGGERKIPVNTEYKTWVKIAKLGNFRAEYKLKLFVDGKLVRTNDIKQDEEVNTLEFLFSFSNPGVHTFETQIFPVEGKDTYLENNHLLKVIDVVDRPKVYVVSDDINSPLIQILKANYRVYVAPTLKPTFTNYDLVIIDNKKKSDLSKSSVDALSNYLAEGNGLLVVGGDKSFEKGNYANSNLERILPVISTEKPKDTRNPIAVAFLMDVSGSMAISTGTGYTSYLEETKAIVINLLRQLNPEDSVSVVAFNVPAWTIIDLTKIGDNRDLIEKNILKLKPASGGGTRFLPALSRAEGILKGYKYDSYIVFLSDGVPIGEEDDTVLGKIKTIGGEGVKFYAISVGDRAQALEGQNLMQSMAKDGSGRYFWMEDGQRLNAAFREEEEKNGEGKNFHTIRVYDKYHFITKDLDINTKIKNFNGVTAKSISQVLVSTLDNKPIVTVWRFGLGRVATITTDNGDDWSKNLYSEEEGRLISRITNWAIGDLEKKKKLLLTTQDISLGDDAIVIIKSESKPLISVEKLKEGASLKGNEKNGKKVEIRQIDEKLFSATLKPNDEGIYILKAKTEDGKLEDNDAIAVNPPREYLSLGINYRDLKQIAEMTNGSVYNFSEDNKMVEDILNEANNASIKKVFRKEDISFYFLIAALGLFFFDVVVRRIKEIFVLKKV